MSLYGTGKSHLMAAIAAVFSEIKRAKSKVINLLQSCQNNEAYTAVKATIIAGDQNYNQIVSHLKKLGLWIEPLVSLDHNMRQYQLEEIH